MISRSTIEDERTPLEEKHAKALERVLMLQGRAAAEALEEGRDVREAVRSVDMRAALEALYVDVMPVFAQMIFDDLDGR